MKKMAGTKITDFFNKQKTISNLNQPENVNRITDAENFYQSCLRQKECEKNACIKLKTTLKAQLSELKAKHLDHDRKVKLCKSIVHDKNNEIARLEKIIRTSTTEQTEAISTGSSMIAASTENQISKLRFSEFSNDFTSQQLAELRSMGLNTRDDSSFVLLSLKFIYADRLSSLKNKSISGRTNKNVQSKEKITPEKETIIRKMFAERLLDVDDDKIERGKRLNQLIKNALANIRRSVAAKEKEKQVVRQLEYDDE